MAAFPSSLYINRSGYSASVGGNMIASSVSGGLFVQVLDYDSSTAMVSATINTDRAGLNDFKSFYDVDLFNGTASFTINLDLGGGIKSYNSQIIGLPGYDGGSDPKWSISINLEVENMAAL